MSANIYIGMPVYQGSEFVAEAVQSIRNQTYGDFRLVMSVDGPEDSTVEACRSLTSDPRIEMVVQPRRLGWPGNFNWLARHCDREYFCYWQQDDLASDDYLMVLHESQRATPDTAIAYTDVQWFGERTDRDSAVDIDGTPFERALQEIEALHYVPLRGLVRASMIPDRADPIPEVETSGHQQEFVYLADLAAAGRFQRVSEGLYFKRAHRSNAHREWFAESGEARRDEWSALGNGLIGVAERTDPGANAASLLAVVLDRLTIVRSGRGFWHAPPQTPAGVSRSVREFLGRYPDRLRNTAGVDTLRSNGFERPVHSWVTSAIAAARLDLAFLDVLLRDADSDVTIETGNDDPGSLMLGRGWSTPEAWGVWTDSAVAEINLPPHRFARVELHGHPFAPDGPVRIGLSDGRGPIDFQEFSSECSIGIDLTGADGACAVVIHLPDATSPHAAGVSVDQRTLGFEMRSITLRR